MKRNRIVVVEDENDVRALISLHLKRNGYDPLAVANGEAALELLAPAEKPAEKKESFDLAILDWMLPGVSGLDICKSLKGRIPVLMVTARADAADIIQGLEAGADDYITKPFDLPVFLARVKALMRRVAPSTDPHPTQLRLGQLKLDMDRHETFCGEEEIQLTPSEFKLLSALMSHRGRVLSRAKLIELVQGQGVAVVDRAIDTHVFGLRKKLGPCSGIIETIRGVGYRIHSE